MSVLLVHARAQPNTVNMNGVASLQYATDLISFPLAELLNSTDASMKSLDNVALFLGALTAGGGITGYVRTGSVPSVAAGVTVGALVYTKLYCSVTEMESNYFSVRTRWPSHPQQTTIRH